MLTALLTTELPLLVLHALRVVDETPKPEDVKAGWTAFIVFLLLAAAVAVLGFSLTKQLRKAKAARDAGVYGDEPVTGAPDAPSGDAPVVDRPGSDRPGADGPRA